MILKYLFLEWLNWWIKSRTEREREREREREKEIAYQLPQGWTKVEQIKREKFSQIAPPWNFGHSNQLISSQSSKKIISHSWPEIY